MLRQPTLQQLNQYLPDINGARSKESTLTMGVDNVNSEQSMFHVGVFFRVVLAQVPIRVCLLFFLFFPLHQPFEHSSQQGTSLSFCKIFLFVQGVTLGHVH